MSVVSPQARAGVDIHLATEERDGAEGFSIVDSPDGGVNIVGHSDLGLLYGVGKFLRTSRFEGEGFRASSWRGTSIPACPVRGIYFAVHFDNFYEAAPTADVEQYLEDLVLWGMNSVLFHFPPQQFDGFDDPRARKNIEQIRSLMVAAKRLGLRVGLIEPINCGFRSAPRHPVYKPFPDDLGRRGNAGVLLCPSHPDGRDYLLGQWEDLLREFGDVGLDFFVSWPYDEGGCGCAKCWPWGARGFLTASKEVARLVRKLHPMCKFVLSTWVYDTPPAGEWDSLAQALAEDGSWVDYIMADSHEDFPQYPLQNPVPGNRPLLNFPEISMCGIGPWGGHGANPLPGRFRRLWNQASHKLSGGFPYSEGIYEDINKVLCLQFYWDKERSAADIIREYVHAEFAPAVVEDVLRAINIMERNHRRDRIADTSEEACELMERADRVLGEQERQSWRWRILLLRAQIDRELHRNGGRPKGPVLAEAFAELTEIYHAQSALESVRPPKVECV